MADDVFNNKQLEALVPDELPEGGTESEPEGPLEDGDPDPLGAPEPRHENPDPIHSQTVILDPNAEPVDEHVYASRDQQDAFIVGGDMVYVGAEPDHRSHSERS